MISIEVVEHRLSEEERICERCGSVKHEMSKQVKRVLEIIPAQVKVREDVYFVYSCRTCEHTETTTPIVTAEMPASVIPGSLASPSAIAHVMTQKYVMGIPLYRQEQQFRQLGVELSRQTLANWILAASDRWLTPIYDRMRDHLLQQEVLHADETTLQVLREEGRKASTHSYLWLCRSGQMVLLSSSSITRRLDLRSIAGSSKDSRDTCMWMAIQAMTDYPKSRS